MYPFSCLFETLTLAGCLFMGSTEEQLGLLSTLMIDVSSYSNILLSFGFFIFMFAFVLIMLWEHLTGYSKDYQYTEAPTGFDRLEQQDSLRHHNAANNSSREDDDEDDDSDDRHLLDNDFLHDEDAVELKPTHRIE